MPQAPADVISGLYEAFGRGDIPAILAMIDEQIDWHAPENLPHGGHFQGRDAVGRFFQGIGETWEGLHLELRGHRQRRRAGYRSRPDPWPPPGDRRGCRLLLGALVDRA